MPLHITWASLQHVGWVPLISPLGERESRVETEKFLFCSSFRTQIPLLPSQSAPSAVTEICPALVGRNKNTLLLQTGLSTSYYKIIQDGIHNSFALGSKNIYINNSDSFPPTNPNVLSHYIR